MGSRKREREEKGKGGRRNPLLPKKGKREKKKKNPGRFSCKFLWVENTGKERRELFGGGGRGGGGKKKRGKKRQQHSEGDEVSFFKSITLHPLSPPRRT